MKGTATFSLSGVSVVLVTGTDVAEVSAVRANNPLLASRRCSEVVFEQAITVPPPLTKSFSTLFHSVPSDPRIVALLLSCSTMRNTCLPTKAAASSDACVTVVVVSWKLVKCEASACLVRAYSPVADTSA